MKQSALLLRIQEAPNSNFGLETGHSNQNYSLFSSVPPDKVGLAPWELTIRWNEAEICRVGYITWY